MATRITDEQKIEINRLYKAIGTYSGVAKQMGIAPSTVKKYVIEDFVEVPQEIIEGITPKLIEEIAAVTDVYEATTITPEEIEKMKQLWKELLI